MINKKTFYNFFVLCLILSSAFNHQLQSNELRSADNTMFVQNYSYAIEKENNILSKRKINIKKNLEDKFNINLDNKKIPTISICCSGGGFRSMLSTAGFLCGAQQIGLLGLTSYITTLSGSTWFVIPWILSQKDAPTFTKELILRLDHFNNLKKITHINMSNLKEIKNFLTDAYSEFFKIKQIKQKYNQKISIVDLYGVFLANLLLDEFKQEKFNLKLSDLEQKINAGNYPYPVFTAVSQFDKYQYQWLEFTPNYVASPYLDSSINVQAFGKKFYDGKSNIPSQEESLGFLMGIFGSAFSTSFKDSIGRIGMMINQPEIQQLFKTAEEKIETNVWANKKIFPAQIANFTHGMQDSPIKNLSDFSVVDGGYYCNIPVDSALQEKRQSDIIIIIDNTSERFSSSNYWLRQVEIQAKQKKQKFPPIDYEIAKNKNFAVFKDENDSTVPTIIYIQLKKDLSYAKTFDPQKTLFCSAPNFFYSKQQSQLLSGLTKHIVEQHENEIFDVIREKII